MSKCYACEEEYFGTVYNAILEETFHLCSECYLSYINQFRGYKLGSTQVYAEVWGMFQ